MDAKVGDKISLDAKKVGQPRRTGSVRALVQGLSGVRYEIEWDDGSVSVIAPGAGNLLVEGHGEAKRSREGARSNGKKKAAKAKPKAKSAPKKPKAKKK